MLCRGRASGGPEGGGGEPSIRPAHLLKAQRFHISSISIAGSKGESPIRGDGRRVIALEATGAVITPPLTWKSRRPGRVGIRSRSVTVMKVWPGRAVMVSNSLWRRIPSSSLATSSSRSSGGSPRLSARLASSASFKASTSERSCPWEPCSRTGRPAEVDVQVVGVGAEAGEAPAQVQLAIAAPGPPPGPAATSASLVASAMAGALRYWMTRRDVGVQRHEQRLHPGRQGGGDGPAAHHQAGAGARQLLVVGGQQGRVGGAPAEHQRCGCAAPSGRRRPRRRTGGRR